MLTNTLERPARDVAMATRQPVPQMKVEAPHRPDADRDGIDTMVARLLAAAEDSVPGTSYAAARRRILRHLESRGPLTIAGIARAWAVTPEHLTQLVHDLEQDGLIEADALADRPDRLRLTAHGTAALAATRSLQLDLISRLLLAAASGDQTAARALYSRLRAALDSHANAAS
jgi:DNA-binding MarR family transcriptional regulator